jgi:hypothetical protein
MTRLQLIKLGDELAQKGFTRFGYLNSLETELLPTIKMVQLEGANFKEKGDDNQGIKSIIEKHTRLMNKDSLEELIMDSQKKLLKSTFVASVTNIQHEKTRFVFAKRTLLKPENVLETDNIIPQQVG